MPKFSGFGQAKSFDLDQAYELISSRRGFAGILLSDIELKRLSSIMANCHRFLHPSELKDYASTLSSMRTLWHKFSGVTSLSVPLSGEEVQSSLPIVVIPGVGAVISVTSIYIIPIQSVAMPAKASNEFIVVCAPDEKGMSNVQGSELKCRKAIFPPADGAENIMDILDCDPNPTECMVIISFFSISLEILTSMIPFLTPLYIKGESGDMSFKEKMAQDFLGNDLCLNNSRMPPPLCPSRASQDVSVFNIDAVIREVNKSGTWMTGQVIVDMVFPTPFKRLHCLKGEFDNLSDLINESGGDVTPLKNKACDHKDLQESYFDRMATKIKLNEASNRLDIESTYYNALKAKLGQVESRHEELQKKRLKERQLLSANEDLLQEVKREVVANEDLLQEVKREVIDLQGQIDSLNAIEVINLATKSSLEKVKLM
ncbi:LOW QUALITY PROTEIN: hypothetical protein Cgig2_009229 [Carnegiea gigantea]|uniref:Uncharacterized protein n=1 Tax=Carnegiea gigantea TaxID=171969 RepID=A0A9Q1KA28_9CARY|nr:LOW QUALITY PROTEIN: hypothetical protein Cgig2_009229 [Carnegiea gigantea]